MEIQIFHLKEYLWYICCFSFSFTAKRIITVVSKETFPSCWRTAKGQSHSYNSAFNGLRPRRCVCRSSLGFSRWLWVSFFGLLGQKFFQLKVMNLSFLLGLCQSHSPNGLCLIWYLIKWDKGSEAAESSPITLSVLVAFPTGALNPAGPWAPTDLWLVVGTSHVSYIL